MRRLASVLALTVVVAWLPDALPGAVGVSPPSAPIPHTAASSVTALRPNVVLVLTDDQPVKTLQMMPHVLALRQRGMTFTRAFVSNSLCCPSRSTLLTGLSSGRTGVWTNGDRRTPWGGWPAFRHNGRNLDGSLFRGTGNNEARTLALYLHRAGYRTGLFGKYLNHYEETGRVPAVPPGWSSWHSFVGGNGAYYDYSESDNGVLQAHGSDPRDYSTDVFGREARRFLRRPRIQDGSTPFFLYFTPFAPHGGITPAPRDLGVQAPTSFETPAYNERDVSDKPPYVRATAPLSETDRGALHDAWDRQYGALLDVDRWIGRFERALPAAVHRRTIFIFTSDNGVEWGDHRLRNKGHAYERSVHVPLIVAGRGILRGTSDVLAENADLTPTILDLAGLRGVGGPYSGRSLVPVLRGTGTLRRKTVLLEHASSYGTPSFCGVRTRRWMYALYSGGFQELYHLRTDPYELHNVAREHPYVRAHLRARALRLCRPRPPDW